MTELPANLRTSLPVDQTPNVSFSHGVWRCNPPTAAVIVASLGFLLVLSWIDWRTGPELHFSLFYAAPVLATAWFVNRLVGYFMAFICVTVWLVAELAGAATYTNPAIAVWNTLLRAVCLLALVKVLADLRDLSTRLDELVGMRTRELQLLANQLSTAEDHERRRLAISIHEEFGQRLTVLKLNLDSALPLLQSEQALRRIAYAATEVNELIQQTRNLTFDLHPAMLDHLGLVPTLCRYAEEVGPKVNVEFTVNEQGRSHPLPQAAANYLFRSVKELVNNAVKHGHARQVVVSVYWATERLRVVVDDDGCGFDSKPLPVQSPRGLGLTGIEERMRSFGGRFALDSTIGKGTRVILEFPMLAGKQTP